MANIQWAASKLLPITTPTIPPAKDVKEDRRFKTRACFRVRPDDINTAKSPERMKLMSKLYSCEIT